MPKRRIIPFFIPHMGCPHACVFCDQQAIGGTAAPPSPGEVQTALKAALAGSTEPAEAAFYGGSFTALPEIEQEKLLSAALPFVKSGKLTGIRLSTRPDCVDEGILRFLAAFGVKTVELGAQSMDDRVLSLSNRGHTAEDTVKAASLICARGFSLILQMMCGLPGDSRETSVASARKIAALRPDGARIYPVVVLKNTPLYESTLRGEYAPLSLAEAVEITADMLEALEQAAVPVIRVGLHPSEELKQAVFAGPYHPAFGEIAKGVALRRKIDRLLSEAPPGAKAATVFVPKASLSAALGQKRENLRMLRAAHPRLSVAVCGAETVAPYVLFSPE